MTRVRVTSVLHHYTGGVGDLDVPASSVGGMFDELDRRFPGFRFRVVDESGRIRPTILVCVDKEICRDLSRPLRDGESVRIIAALSGG
jgi:molybdopterin converting factor small subunit